VDKLLEAISFSANENEVLKNIWVCRLALKYVLDQLAASPAFSAFQESVIALPAAASSKVEPVEESGCNADSLIRENSTLRPPKSKLSRKKVNEQMEVFDDLVDPILSARRHLINAPSQLMMSSPTHVLHRVFGIGSDISTLLSVFAQNLPGLKIHPLSHALGLDFPRNFAFQRELAVTRAETEKKERSTVPTWPAGADIQTQSPGPDVLEFQQQYIDILPSTWTAISMTLNHAKDELSICRYRSGESPFILRLPISRSNLIDPGDEGFDYQAAEKELKTIVDLSNYSAHEAKSITASADKARWWDARKALDERMRDLLFNVEKSWLGGFKGIFVQQPKHPQLLANFQQALLMSLNRHLPSRRGQSGTAAIQFDPRVLELFTGLGDPNDSDVDLDDMLSELLYFVVDSLNFNGEPNAFDEVDFDSVTISTTHTNKRMLTNQSL
jgi:separase